MVVVASPARASRTIVVRGFSPTELRRQAEKKCRAAFGDDAWRITGESFTPCVQSLGGHVRLYEGRFNAART